MGSRSSTKSGASTSGMEDGKVVEPGPGSGSVPAVRKEKQAQSQTSTTHRSAESYSRSERLGSPLVCHNDPTTLADVAPPSPPTLAQLPQGAGEEGAQTRPSKADEGGQNIAL